MKTIEINIYSFDELSEEAKEVAISNYREKRLDHDFIWSEAHETVKEFHKVFGFTEEGFNSWLDFRLDISDDVEELTGIRLRTWILNNFTELYKPKFIGSLKSNEIIKHKRIHSKPLSNGNVFNPYLSGIQKTTSCVLTGVCYDDDLLQPFYDFIDKDFTNDHKTIVDILNNCFASLKKSIDNEIESRETDEYIIEEIEANEMEFDGDGEIF